MALVEIALTGEQLAKAYQQLDASERHSFLTTVLSQPTHRQAALELLTAAQVVLSRKFPPGKQKLLDQLLDKNTEGTLNPAEQKQLAQLMEEYGAGMIEKACARYAIELARQSAPAQAKHRK